VAALFLAAAVLLLRAARTPAPWTTMSSGTVRYRLLSVGVMSLVALSVAATIALSLAITLSSGADPRFYNSDAAAFNHYNADLPLHGHNPYTADALFWDAIRRFPDAGATPLRLGRYAHSVYGPSLEQVVRDVKAELRVPAARGQEYAPASMHSYPALAFLVYVPAVWLGLPTTLPISL